MSQSDVLRVLKKHFIYLSAKDIGLLTGLSVNTVSVNIRRLRCGCFRKFVQVRVFPRKGRPPLTKYRLKRPFPKGVI